MLFLIRTAFWLMIIVLLLPTDEQQRNEVYGTAQAAVHDVATFCDRRYSERRASRWAACALSCPLPSTSIASRAAAQ